MKKLLFFLAALMFVASCAKDTTTTPVIKGEKVVSFKVTAPKMQTRYGEGAEANQLFWAVYKNGQRLDDVSAIDPAEAVAINMSVDVEISLMEGLDYDILFWAQNEDAPYTFDGAKVTIDYDALSANEEIYDAFFRNYHVDADQTEPHRVELRRPFAQLNIGTADTAKAQSAGFTVENTSVTVEACTVLDLATGEASEPQELTFAMSQKASDTYGDDPDTFDIISMNYLLVNNEKEVVDVTFNAEGGNDAIEREYLNVPLQRNHRTYILGDILTSSKLFNVYINPAFDDEDLFNDPSDDQRQPVKDAVIYYTTSDGKIVYLGGWEFDNVVENTYENGQGKIIFDGPITKILDEAFRGRKLTSIVIPDCVQEIESTAFYECDTLTSVTIGEGVIKIGSGAFSECRSLKAFYGKYASSDNRCLVIDEKINSFAPYGLTSYTIPDGIKGIEDSAFSSCYGFTSITIPNSVTEIGSAAFSGCRFSSVTIPENVTYIGKDPFNSRVLTAFYGSCTSPDNRCLILNDKLIDFAACGLTGSYTIPDGVTTIGYYAFNHCYLTDITIPDSVITVERDAFSYSPLQSVTFGRGVTNIEMNAFASCHLTNIDIPDGVISIGEHAFSGCQYVTNITIPDSVKKIGTYAFALSNINHVSVYCKATTPPIVDHSLFGYANSNLTIYVPTASVDDYKNADGWSDYADYIVDGEF